MLNWFRLPWSNETDGVASAAVVEDDVGVGVALLDDGLGVLVGVAELLYEEYELKSEYVVGGDQDDVGMYEDDGVHEVVGGGGGGMYVEVGVQDDGATQLLEDDGAPLSNSQVP